MLGQRVDNGALFEGGPCFACGGLQLQNQLLGIVTGCSQLLDQSGQRRNPAEAERAGGAAQAVRLFSELGAIARPGQVHFVTLLPKTRSGKLLRRSIQALAEGRDPGDLTTIEDPGALEQIRAALAAR